jgi:hypothetical protein
MHASFPSSTHPQTNRLLHASMHACPDHDRWRPWEHHNRGPQTRSLRYPNMARLDSHLDRSSVAQHSTAPTSVYTDVGSSASHAVLGLHRQLCIPSVTILGAHRGHAQRRIYISLHWHWPGHGSQLHASWAHHQIRQQQTSALSRACTVEPRKRRRAPHRIGRTRPPVLARLLARHARFD